MHTIIAQDFSKEEKRDVINVVYDFFYKSPIAQRNANRNSGKSERFILMLEVSNEYKIDEVSPLAENNNLDSGFAILNSLSKTDFQNWKSKSAKNKTVVIPIVVINRGEEYIESLGFIDNFEKLGQTSEIVILSGIEFKWPIRRKEY